MPVAKDSRTEDMGQDSRAQKPNPGLISRVRRTIGKSRKGSYSFHESSLAYADIDQGIVSSDDTQIPNDYYRLDHNSTNGGINGVNTESTDVEMKVDIETSENSDTKMDHNHAKDNELCSQATNGFHNVDRLSDSENFEALKRGGNLKKVDDSDFMGNKYMINSEEFNDNGDHGSYSIPGDEVTNHSNFEQQGAKPKMHYSKNKNGLRETDLSAVSATKRQAVKVNQGKLPGSSVRQDYLNVDLAETRIVDDNSFRSNMHWQSSIEDDIKEALKGPVLPPLKLSFDGHEPICTAPKTPNIELVFRKDEIIDDELEEIKFASRAVRFRIDPNAAVQRSSSTTSRPEGQLFSRESRECEREVDPSEIGMLLLSQTEPSQHHIPRVTGENDYGEESRLNPDRTNATASSEDLPPAVDRTSKPVFIDEDDSLILLAQRPDPPPIPPRVPTHDDDDDDDDEEPTHEAIMHFKSPPREPGSKSLSLPRNISPGFYETAEQEQNSHKVNRRKVLSSIFHRKSKRHSTFNERPLPAIPPLQPGKFPVNISRQRAATMATDRRLPQPPPEPLEELPPPPPPKVPIKSPREIAEVEKIMKDRGEFASSLRKISDSGWYWGPMSWDDAETRLENTPDGSFLVRDSSDERHILSLSFRASGTTHHTRIEHQHGKFSFWSQPTSHGSASVVDFIDEAMRHSRSGSFLYFLRPRMPGLPPAPVQLLYPISRFQKARSLQHMCRFVIRKNVRLDHIDRLPLPKRLKEYMREGQYYTPEALEP